jgi:hypothetical protein
MTSKNHILDEIKRTALSNNGKPLGKAAFESATGIKMSEWHGKYWRQWSDAIIESGFQPNIFIQAYDTEFLCEKYALFVRELGSIPAAVDLRMKANNDKSFPSHRVWDRFVSKPQLIQQIIEFCKSSDAWNDVLAILVEYKPSKKIVALNDKMNTTAQDGYVYLIKSGKHYKIGMTKDFCRRANEISIELPERHETIHVIRTDDPSGIEAYWHKRFSEKRGNGEWFNLTATDIKAFKRRKFM